MKTELRGVMGVLSLLEGKGVDINQYVTSRGLDANKLLNDLQQYNYITDEELEKVKSPF